MKYFYLDNNIVIDLKNDRNKDVKSIINSLDRTKNRIVFSPAHIEEIAATVKHYDQTLDTAYEKLEFLKKLTDSYCFLPFPRGNLRLVKSYGVNIYQEDPIDTFTRVFNSYDQNWIPEGHQKQKLTLAENLEKDGGVSSSEMNNADMNGILDEFKKELFKIVTVNYKILKKDSIMKQFLPRKPITIGMLRYASLMPYFPMFEMTMEKLMEYLEFNRYFPDKSDKNIASLHDTTHAIYGAYADVFVTNDRRFANKVKAVYKWLGVDTKVMTRAEFIDEYNSAEIIA